MFYDAHCHLQDPRLAPFWTQIQPTLVQVGIAKAVVNGTRESDWPRILELAVGHSFIIPALGLHPWYLNERSAQWANNLAAENPPAIGEIGLDRWMRNYDSATQEQVFVEQLRLAARLNRPASIHCLKAWGRLLEILSSEALPKCGFLLHSYGGPADMIQSFADLGGFFSISGYFAHARKARQREVFKRVPLERLLVETDAPDMQMPAEVAEFSLEESGLNHPANIRAVYRFAAELRGVPLNAFSSQMEKNFHQLFKPV